MDADRHAAEWLMRLALPRLIIATKVDKLTQGERVRNVRELERVHEGPVLGLSSQTGEGMKELWKTIDALLRQQPPPTDQKNA
jgi:GTP-binding protein EngB required for normal cell division